MRVSENVLKHFSQSNVTFIVAALLLLFSCSVALAISPQERLTNLATTHFKLAYFGEDQTSGKIREDYPIVRWSESIRISFNSATDSHPELIGQFQELLTLIKASGHDVDLLPQMRESSANARISFADADSRLDTEDLVWFSNLPSGYDAEVERLWRVFSKRKTCAMGGGFIHNYEVAYFLAFVHVNAAHERKAFCGSRLLLGLLGFQGGRTIVGRSIFSDDFAQMGISELDKIVLRMLADDRLKKGMKYNTATNRIIRTIASDLVDQLDAEEILRLVDSGR